MKVQVQSKKGLKTTLSIIIDKNEIKKKLDLRLIELQKEIDLKGFRKGKSATHSHKKPIWKSYLWRSYR